MFFDVRKWAGIFKRSEKNIGGPWIRIGVELIQLLDTTKYWIEHTIYPADEIAIRFKHRLVNIHCFPNGNGWHSRIMADIMIDSIFEREIFIWHHSNMVKACEVRSQYIAAIKETNKGNLKPLLEFARN